MCHLFFRPFRRPRPGPRASPPRPSALALLKTSSNGLRHSFPKHLIPLTRGSRCLGRFPGAARKALGNRELCRYNTGRQRRAAVRGERLPGNRSRPVGE